EVDEAGHGMPAQRYADACFRHEQEGAVRHDTPVTGQGQRDAPADVEAFDGCDGELGHFFPCLAHARAPQRNVTTFRQAAVGDLPARRVLQIYTGREGGVGAGQYDACGFRVVAQLLGDFGEPLHGFQRKGVAALAAVVADGDDAVLSVDSDHGGAVIE